MSRMIRCLSCGDPCLLDESLDGVLVVEAHVLAALRAQYVQEGDEDE